MPEARVFPHTGCRNVYNTQPWFPPYSGIFRQFLILLYLVYHLPVNRVCIYRLYIIIIPHIQTSVKRKRQNLCKIQKTINKGTALSF
jgi:hypothetical protein